MVPRSAFMDGCDQQLSVKWAAQFAAAEKLAARVQVMMIARRCVSAALVLLKCCTIAAKMKWFTVQRLYSGDATAKGAALATRPPAAVGAEWRCSQLHVAFAALKPLQSVLPSVGSPNLQIGGNE